jgi:DNA-binding MarR family transcriptional regulator
VILAQRQLAIPPRGRTAARLEVSRDNGTVAVDEATAEASGLQGGSNHSPSRVPRPRRSREQYYGPITSVTVPLYMSGSESNPARLTLLYQLYVTNQASRRFMRLVLDGAALTSEEFAVLSYLQANRAQTLSRAARDLGLPVTSLATTLASLFASGLIERTPHPRDRRARLLSLTERGRADLTTTLPSFSAAYTGLVERLKEGGADVETMFATIATIRTEIERSCDLIEDQRASDGRPNATG